MIKVAKIIALSFSFPRTYRERTILTGNPPLYTLHSQKVSNYSEIKNMIINHINFEIMNCNINIYLDIIIINNDNGHSEGNEWVKSINNQKFNFGCVKVYNRINIGWSYGAYSYAIDKFVNYYDYLIFTEDDVYIYGVNYINDAIAKFNSINNCGFLSFQGLSNTAFENKGLDFLHARGGVGITSTIVLKEILTKIIKFPYYYKIENNIESYKNIILFGEVAFTNVIHKYGYKLYQICLDNKIVFYDYDVRRNINKHLKPNIVELYTYYVVKYTKEFIYNTLVKFNLYNYYKFIKRWIQVKCATRF